MRNLLALALASLLAGCTSQATCPTTPAAPASKPAEATEKPCAEAPAAAKDQKPSPEVLALAETVKQRCQFERGSYSWSCKEFKEWRSENDDLFEDAGGNEAILAMLEDQDVRMRALAAERGFKAARAFFANKEHAARLLKVIDKERENHVLDAYGKFVASIDAEAMFTKEIQALATHPATELREALARAELPQHPSAFSIALVKTFLDDADNSVKRAAIASLSANGRTRPTDAVCTLLKAQLVRTDKLAEDALDAGTSSKCPGMLEVTASEIEKRAKDPATFAGTDGIDMTNAVGSICWSSEAPDAMKKRMFDVATKAAQKTTDPWRRRFWIGRFRRCDVARAKAALAPYLKDKEKDVSDEAKEEVRLTDEELKQPR